MRKHLSTAKLLQLFIILKAVTSTLAVQAENLLFNSSFELGTKGYASARSVPYTPNNKIVYSGRGFETDSKTAAYGEKALKITLFNSDNITAAWRFNSHEVELKPGRKYTCSFYAKTNGEKIKINSGYLSTMGGWRSTDRKNFEIDGKWKRYNFSFVSNPKAKHIYEKTYFMQINFPKLNAVVWLDGLQLEEGDLTAYAPAKSMEVAVYTASTLIDNAPVKGFFRAISYNKSLSDSPLTLKLNDDFFKTTVESKKFNLNLPAGKCVEKEFTFGSKRFGSFCVTSNFEFADLTYRSAGYFVRVFAPQKLYGKGFQLGMLAGNLESISIRSSDSHKVNMVWTNTYGNVGDYARLTRLSGATFAHTSSSENLSLNPFCLYLVEPERNQFDWKLADRYIRLAEQNNLAPVIAVPPQSLLATWFEKSTGVKVPKWLRNLDRLGKPAGSRLGDWTQVKIVVPPAEVIGELFEAIAKRYGNKIKAYQLFAEANGYMSPNYLVEYMTVAYKAIKRISPNAVFIGMTPTEDFGSKGAGFFAKCLQRGAAKCCDAYAIHPYSASMDDSPVSAMLGIRNLDKIMEKYRAVKPLWNTEVFYLRSTRQSHYTLESLFSADAIARRLLIDMNEGFSHSCPLDMSLFFHNPLLPRQVQSKHVGGQIPSDRFAVFNAIARFINGAKPVKTLELPGNVLCYIFSNDGKYYSTIWGIRDKVNAKLKLPSNTSVTVYDLFGNPVKTCKKQLTLALDRRPLYLEWKGTTDVEKIVKSFKQAHFDMNIPIKVASKLVNDSAGKFSIGIVLHNESSEKQSGFCRVVSKYLETDGRSVSYGEIPPYKSKIVIIPVQLKSNTPNEFDIKINLNTQNRVFSYKKMLKNVKQLNVKNGSWTKNIPIISNGNIPAQDFSASFSLSRNNNDLLVKVKVIDDKRSSSATTTHPWEGDSVELFLDLKPLDGDHNCMELHHELCFQLVVPTNDNGKVEVSRVVKGKLVNTKPLIGIKADVKNTAGGYEANIQIPLESILGELQGKNIGFTLLVNDNDKKKYKHNLTWTGKKNYCDRSGFAILFLK